MDAAISCLPTPPALLATTNFTDAAIARALHFSMSSSASSSSSSFLSAATAHHHQSPLESLLAADLPPYAPHPHATTCVDSVLVADSPRRSPPAAPSRHHQLAPAGGRAGKRRSSRASKRAPTTYITTDPSNFRIMVQQVTGAHQADEVDIDMLLQPTTTAVLLGAGADTCAAAGAYGDHPLLAALAGGGGDEASSSAAALRHHHHQQQQQQQQLQPCFPTLDSWNVMYESNDLPPPPL